ncbi:lycopene cyclase family protein [Modestobacter sp. VKM Ac-2977]|uniref:lycopene cyclase family protein n=1 Tax=Modestobacter sp. VKM Ac-2977 TaxID=3004131 RepID=UPI0022AAFDA2|nr:lycopene cyclase family protein [Modestobacter sp. VKM Ac-2977]MCZ2820729.1 lycopene cyclase family protein [Modestobacter sp. VKM Ac-2977]
MNSVAPDQRWDVVVAGAGPAGLSVAAACAARGLGVVVVAPHLRPWHQTYGMWADELDAVSTALLGDTARTEGPPPLGRRYPVTVVRTTAGSQDIGRSYARLHNDVVHGLLLGQLRAGGGATRTGSVAAVHQDPAGQVVTLADGTTLTGGMVIDARGGGPGSAHQRAWGERVTGDLGGLVPDGGALLMDWAVLREDGAAQPPAFLYGMGLDDGTTLLEATSLAARPPVPLPHLRDRLHRLIAEAGLRIADRPERVAIPLDAAVRRSDGVPVGAAAGLVHPATGYSVATSLRAGSTIADAVLAGADAAAVRALVRSARQRATLGLLGLGREVLVGLDEAETDAFFQAFFSLPEQAWVAYLDVGSAPTSIAATMLRVARALPPPARRRLVATVVRVALPRLPSRRATPLGPVRG